MALENKARQFPVNCIHGGRRTFVFGESAGAKEIVCIPRGSFVKTIFVSVTEAFNGTGASLDIGIAGTPAGLAANANIGLATAGYKGGVTAGALTGDNFFAGDTVILGTFAPGTGGTTGRATIVVEFYPQQD
jgi:hypothetical protein